MLGILIPIFFLLLLVPFLTLSLSLLLRILVFGGVVVFGGCLGFVWVLVISKNKILRALLCFFRKRNRVPAEGQERERIYKNTMPMPAYFLS